MRRWILGIAFMLVGWLTSMQAQQGAEGPDFPPYPDERIAVSNRLKVLPLKVDNSQFEYFPPIISQLGWSCNQASSIGYLLTYELNRKRELDGELPENQYSPSYPWNFLSAESKTTGVSYFDTWEIIKANGCPNIIDFPYTGVNSVWMNGFDKYLRAMKNKVVNNYSISVSDAAGLRVLKTYLFNHNDSFRFGGLANVQIASSGWAIRLLPSDSYDSGTAVITSFGRNVGHALTIVGFNDQVQYDFNGDGLYTNDLDLNDDGEVTMADWEKGALLAVNTYGKDWGSRGKAYIPYRLLTRYGYEGGIWNRSVHVVDVLHNYEPALVLKLEIAHSNRGMLRVTLGCSNDPEAEYPEYIHAFPMLNYHGGLSSLGAQGDDSHMHLGLDITPVLAHLESGKPVKFFLMIDERDPLDLANGSVYSYSIINYLENDTLVAEKSGVFPIKANQTTILEIGHELNFDPVQVADYQIQYTSENQWLSVPLYASGISGSANWEIYPDYREDTTGREFPELSGDYLPFYTSSDGFLTIDLPFDFPFYGEMFDKLYADESGYLYLQTQYQDYPYSIDKELVFRQRKSIVPFGQDLMFYQEGNGIYYESTDSVAKIFWDCSAQIGSSQGPFRFACYLYPDGLIEFHYGGDLNGSERSDYRSGLSRGNGKQVFVTTSSNLGKVHSDKLVRLIPYQIPPKTKIESNRYLLTRPEEKNQFYEIKVKVTDINFQESFGLIPISTLDFSSPDMLATAFPNPFTESTSLSFVVKEKSLVRIQIFDLFGRHLRDLLVEEFEKGIHQIDWDGRSDHGSECLPGVYLVRIFIGEEKQSVKILKNAC
ncbi:MAG: T9SS type A sorting domain-containing protein [Bacteroidota bacterium]|nr:T9SS type A sorting domain-containing protein [Bacteroidota bacterium]